MKKLLLVPILLICFGMFSCKKEAVLEQQVSMQQKNMPIINPGLLLFGTCDNWYVSLLQIDRNNLTNNYKSVNLTFCPDNTFVVSNDILAVSGNWYITLEKEIPITLILDLKYPVDTYPVERTAALWGELGGEWKIVRLQKNMLSLQMDEQEKRLIIERGVLY